MPETRNQKLIDRLARSGHYTEEEIREWRKYDRVVHLNLTAAIRRLEKLQASVGSLEGPMACRADRHMVRPVLGEVPRLMLVGYRHTHFCKRCKTVRRKVVDSNSRPQGYSYDDSQKYALVKDNFTRREAFRLIEVSEWSEQLDWLLQQSAMPSNVQSLPRAS